MAKATETKQKKDASQEEQAPGVEVQEAELPEAVDSASQGPGTEIDVLLDTVMPVDVSLGQVELQIRDLLQLGDGAVLKLDKRVGEPVDILLCGARFASGTLVVVGDRLGVRVKEISSGSLPEQPAQEQQETKGDQEG